MEQNEGALACEDKPRIKTIGGNKLLSVVCADESFI